MGRTSFVLGSSWANRMLDVPDEDFAMIVKAVFQYAVNGEYEEVSGLHKALVSEMVDFISENNERYDEVCRKRREAGSLGGKQKVANAKQMLPNATKCLAKDSKRVHDNDNDNDNDNDYDYDNDYDNDNVNDNENVNDNVVLTDKERKETNVSKREVVDALVAKWNSYADRGSIPLIRSVSVDSKTGKSVLARVKERGLEEVVEVMDMVFRSNYLRGFKNGWCAKFDWIFLPTNYEKILNGNYNEHDVVKTQNDMIDTWVADYHARKGEVI